MSLRNIQAVAFDFGNTLCPWDEEQYWDVTTAGLRRICDLGDGICIDDAHRVFARIRDEDSGRNLPRLRENDLVSMLATTAKDILNRDLTHSETDDVIQVHTEAFVSVSKAFAGVERMLSRLSESYRLALVSNYPLSACIRLSLDHMGIAHFFDTTLVSGDLGIVKPGRRVFRELLDTLGLPADRVLFVGDDWIADIVGAHASGLPSIHVRGVGRSGKAELMDGVFRAYLQRALTMPELSGWEDAQPVAVLDSVVELEEVLRQCR